MVDDAYEIQEIERAINAAHTGATMNRRAAAIGQLKARLLFASSFLVGHQADACSECPSDEQPR